MRATVEIRVQRDNGVILSREFTIDQERLWATRSQGGRRETRAEFRARFERQLTAAVNSVLGG